MNIKEVSILATLAIIGPDNRLEKFLKTKKARKIARDLANNKKTKEVQFLKKWVKSL